SGRVLAATTWQAAKSPYKVVGPVVVDSGIGLTIEGGTVIKFLYRLGCMEVDGQLELLSTPGNEVVLTSERDDTFGGDTNRDGKATQPAPGDWTFLRLKNSDNILHDVIIRYGGAGRSGMLWCDNCSPTLRNCRLERALDLALNVVPETGRVSFPKLENIRITNGPAMRIVDNGWGLANVKMRNSCIDAETGDGMYLENLNARCVFEGMTVRGKGNAMTLLNSNPTIRNSIVHGCGKYGIQELDFSSDPVLDRNCFHENVAGHYYDDDMALALNTEAEINKLNPPGTNNGNIVADPLFVNGPGGDGYLSQIAAGQGKDSPCLDRGNPVAIIHGATRTDHYQDDGLPDLGYHHALNFDADLYTVKVSRQNVVNMLFAAGGKNAAVQYVVACGVSGTRPGTVIEGLAVPLNIDVFTLGALWLYGSPMFRDFAGMLDANGTARPVLNTLGPLDPSLKGTRLTVVAMVPFTYASNPIEIEFVD
ncbi:MAG: right-handed parallel beta-helix repeat-containing protein, partial [Phycisphaerae bacterium]|nr:right-handed parallel beta-helix repeat-containing protein [Phycisphaerae bacterium]